MRSPVIAAGEISGDHHAESEGTGAAAELQRWVRAATDAGAPDPHPASVSSPLLPPHITSAAAASASARLRSLRFLVYWSRLSLEYKEGVSKFLDFAFGMTSGDTIPCPCKKCNNVLFKQRNEVETDLMVNGVVTGYTRWLLHGKEIETIESSDCDSDGESVHDILEAHFGAHNVERWETRDLGASDSEEPNEGATKFFKLLKDGNEQLYPGCSRFSKLSSVIKLFHIKCLSHMTNKRFCHAPGPAEALPVACPDPPYVYTYKASTQKRK
uniref:Transposase-associated domain-containing protein n=1 Tax=Ananas comosus var. bracteatus TaxID=296719 RepID=A0A6V7PQ80_ANACO|nr:unnamed protein product [Ananas comosus var. bracteatus]